MPWEEKDDGVPRQGGQPGNRTSLSSVSSFWLYCCVQLSLFSFHHFYSGPKVMRWFYPGLQMTCILDFGFFLNNFWIINSNGLLNSVWPYWCSRDLLALNSLRHRSLNPGTWRGVTTLPPRPREVNENLLQGRPTMASRQIQLVACFCMAHNLRMIFKF